MATESGGMTGHFLPEILEKICHHMDIRSLSRAAVVSKLWNEVVEYELRNRGPQRIFISASNEDVYEFVDTRPQVTLLFVGSARLTSKIFAINDRNVHLGILANYKKYFPHYLVAVKSYILMMDDEIITYTSRMKCNFLSLLIPQYRDLRIRIASSQYFNRDQIKFMNNLLPQDSSSKVTIILFAQGPNVNFSVLELIQQSMQERKQKCSLWGMAGSSAPFTALNGEIDKVTIKDSTTNNTEQEKPDRIVAISITGSSLESWSIVISCIVKKDDFDKQLLDFRNQLRLKKRSIGLVCGPCEVLNLSGIEGLNSSNMYNDYKELMGAVKTVFPDVPFTGMYDATFACYYGLETKTTSGFNENVQHSMSVSLMILTFD